MSEPGNTPGGDENTADRCWDELKTIQDTLMKVWQSFMLWSIWFLTALYGTITYVAGFDKDNTKLTKSFALAAASTSVVLDVVAIGATVALLRYTREATDRAEHLSRSSGFHPGVSPRTMMAAPLLKWICWGFLIGYFVYLALWAYLVLYPGTSRFTSAIYD